MPLEKMDDFFDVRADTYDDHMLVDLELDEFYEEIASRICPDKPNFRLLDLGCGTGLELSRLFDKYPDMQVTGVDLSPKMLEQLRMKFPDKTFQLICGSYFDTDFSNGYDVVLSTYSLHHFSAEEKGMLYRKIYAALNFGGVFLLGDYTALTKERQDEMIAENIRIRQEQGLPDGEFYHVDIPFTAENEIRLMKDAGFQSVEVVRRWDNTSVILAR